MGTTMAAGLTAAEVLADPNVMEAVRRNIIDVKGSKVTYTLATKKQYDWSDPEEWVRCLVIAYLVIARDYPAHRMKTEVQVPKRTPSDWADVVVFLDDACKIPYLIVECKRDGISSAERAQGIEQLFGNANSLRGSTPLWGLYVEGRDSLLFDVSSHSAMERELNKRGNQENLAAQYGVQPVYAHVVGASGDIGAAKAGVIESKIRRAHSLIWSGGKRDPLRSFDEWSKLLFAKVQDERWTPNGKPREFQVGPGETSAAVANRIHRLFAKACKKDSSIFEENARIELPDRKIFEVVKVLQDVCFVDSNVDNIGAAFENFFGSVFRGELGQYFTMRQIARFTVAMLAINHEDYCLDPTAGSGGFLLEVLLQVWHQIDADFAGSSQQKRIKNDFALDKVFGIEIHDVLARICKINLLLHHDGHTNIEGDRSCLDAVFSRPRLNPPHGKFTKIVGNPPFGDEVREGDEDHLGTNHLENFTVAADRDSVASEHVILERCVDLLEPNGRLGLVLPDGVFNNQGELSNCPRTRRLLVKQGVIEAIVSLPDYAFRRSGAQNKTSILFFRKFTLAEQVRFDQAYAEAQANEKSEDDAIVDGLTAVRYKTFLAEANFVGYTTTGALSDKNDLYRGAPGAKLDVNQQDTILGEYRSFLTNEDAYAGRKSPDCMAIDVVELWQAHSSRRLDPKYYLFKRDEKTTTPAGWVRLPIRSVMRRREVVASPESNPDTAVTVMTISQTGEIRPREAGKGKNPPQWLGMYFDESPSTWFIARRGDVVFSSIDLWKGCISVVPPAFDMALVTKEFPIYEVTDARLDPGFLWCLLRSRYYQRAFRAITTGHSNRRRTQAVDFEAIEIVFPADINEQRALIEGIFTARDGQKEAADNLRQAMMDFSNIIDGRVGEELPEVEAEGEVAEE